MKKWIALVVVVLMGLILALQYLNKKRIAEQAVPGQAQQSGGMEGVSLPPDAANLPVSAEGGIVPTGEFYVKGACEGGSIGEILEARGKTWGPSADSALSPVIKGADMDKVSEALGDYFTCMALSARDPKICDNAPESSQAKKSSPRWECTAVLNDILAAAYMAGQYNKMPACMWLMSEITEDYPASGIKSLNAAEFCSAASKGMENICSSFPALNKNCAGIFPAKKSDCGRDEDCLNRYALYTAVKTADPLKCPSEDRAFCEIFLSKREVSCESRGEKASKLYCAYLEKARANSPQLIKEKREAELRKEMERLEEQKVVETLNKEIKKLIPKK